MTSDPVPVPAPLVAMAIAAASVQEVDSYPVSMSGEEESWYDFCCMNWVNVLSH